MIASTHPQHIPNATFDAFCLEPTLKPHIAGKNWLYRITHMTAPCAAKRKSLNRTVVSGAAGWRTAYCDRIVGEYRKAAVLTV